MCQLHPPTARGADLKSHGCSGGDTDAKPTLPLVPFFPGGGLGAKGGHQVACAVQVTVARGQPARDLAPGGGKLCTALCGLALAPAVSPFRFVFRARGALGWDFLHAPRVCAHCAFLRAGGAVGPAPRRKTWFPGLAPSLPWTVTGTRCACEVSFMDRF